MRRAGEAIEVAAARQAMRLCASALVIGLAAATAAGQAPSDRLPPAFEHYLSTVVHPTAAERKALLNGAVFGKLLPGDAGKDVSVVGAVWIDAPARDYLTKLQDIERFERGAAFRITRRISEPPTAADFATLPLIDEDFKDLRKCRVGDCEVKLDAATIHRLRTQVKWDAADAHAQAQALLRQHALSLVNTYRARGHRALLPYHDRDDPVSLQSEFFALLDNAPSFALPPALRQYLLEYPKVTLPGATDLFYWQQVQFGLKPTIRINHLVIYERPEATIVSSKMLYASHYFWSAFELRVLLADEARGRGFWFITINRSRPDGLTGLIGRLIRGRVRSDTLKGTLTMLRSTKAVVEGQPR